MSKLYSPYNYVHTCTGFFFLVGGTVWCNRNYFFGQPTFTQRQYSVEYEVGKKIKKKGADLGDAPSE